MLDELRRYRVAGNESLAEASYQRVDAFVGDARKQAGAGIERIEAGLCTRVRSEFVGRHCTGAGEASYYNDLTSLIGSAMTGREHSSALLHLLSSLFDRGLPEEHAGNDDLVHCECQALIPVFKSIVLSREPLPRPLARKLWGSEWTQSCGIVAALVFGCVEPDDSLDLDVYWKHFERSSDPVVLRVAARALARSGELGRLIEMAMVRHPDRGHAIIDGISGADPSEQWLDVLETIRSTVWAAKRASPSWRQAIQFVFSEWGREYVRTGKTLHDLGSVVVKRVQGRGDVGQAELVALMNAIPAATMKSTGGFQDPIVTGDKSVDARHAEVEAAIIAIASHCYRRKTTSCGAMLALGCIVREPSVFFEAARGMMELDGVQAAMDDILMGYRTLARRGRLRSGKDRETAITLMKQVMSEFETPTTPFHVLTVAVELNAVELLPELRRMLDRLQAKKLGNHPFLPYSKMVELYEELEAKSH